MASALQPTKIRGLELPNKMVLAPMCTFVAEHGVNEFTDKHMVHYSNIAMGGCGLVMIEATAVEFRGRIDVADLGIWSNRQIPGFRRFNDYVHAYTKSKTAIQLAHCGRKGNVTGTMSPHPRQLGPLEPYGAASIGPSAIAFSDEKGPYMTPDEATTADLEMVKRAFVDGANRAVAAGFDLIEVHSAHGYLLCSFTSPLSNQRTDEYGGSVENRCRFPLEVIDAVRAAIPNDMPLCVRVSATEWMKDGLCVEDNIYYAKEMKKLGVDLLHVSSGGNHRLQELPEGTGFQIPLAERLRKEVDFPVVAVGDVRDLSQAGAILDEGKADFVAVGRAFLDNPYWLRNEASRLSLGDMTLCPEYQVAAYIAVRKAAAAAAASKIGDDLPSATVHGTSSLAGAFKGLFVCCGGQTVSKEAELIN